MGCCFSKELNPNPVSERTSLLQPVHTESLCVQDVKRCGQMNRAAEAASIIFSSDLSSVAERNGGEQEGTVVWDECKEDSCNKPLEKISKDLDGHSSRETAVINSVKRRIAENAVKRAVWFCEVNSSSHREPAPSEPRGEIVSDTLVAHGHHIHDTCTTDISSGVETMQTQEHEQTVGSINRITDPTTNQFTTKYLYGHLLDSDESESSMKRRTQSFYSICSIDTDDLEGEHKPASIMDPAPFNHTDSLPNTEQKVIISTSPGHAVSETFNGTSERREVSEKVCEDLPGETLLLIKAHVLPDVVGMFCDVGSDENAGSEESAVFVSPENVIMENSKNSEDQSHGTGLDRTVDEAIPDLLGRSDRLIESIVEHKNVSCSCQTRVQTDQSVHVTETECEAKCLETLKQEPERVSSGSRNSDNNENHLSYYVQCKEPERDLSFSVRNRTWHQTIPLCVKPYDDVVQNSSCLVSQFIEDGVSAFVSSLEGDLESQGFCTEIRSQETGTINLDSKSNLFKDSMAKLGESLCSYADSKNVATQPEPGSRFNSLQSLNFLVPNISGGNDAALQPETGFQTEFMDYSAINTCPLLTHYDAEKKEMNLGMEDFTCHVSSTELSGVALEFKIAVEHVETEVSSNADHDSSPGASLGLVKDFCENLMSLTQTEQECSPSTVSSFNTDLSIHTNLLKHAPENLENLTIRGKPLFPEAAHESLNLKEGDGCFLKEKAECFNEKTLMRQNEVLSVGRVKSSKMELQKSKSTDLDLTSSRNIGGENTALSLYTELPDTFESFALSKNSTPCESAHIPLHTLLEKTCLQSSSDLSNQELKLSRGAVQDVPVISSAEQQVEMDYTGPRTKKSKSLALERWDGCDKGMECFVSSRFGGYGVDDVLVTSCGLETSETQLISHLSDDSKAIPLPVEPDQVDLYASMPSYEIHFIGPDAVPVQVGNLQSPTSTNELERERGALNMVSDLLGKSEVNKDCMEIGECGPFLSVWAGEPELESAWQYRLSEENVMRRGRQEEGEADLSLDSERVQALTSAYPFSLLVSDEACVWDWRNTYGPLVSVHRCCVAK